MRTMTFECQTHGTFEVDLQDGQDPPIWCPIYVKGRTPCGEVLKRRYDVPAIQFRGSGFYSTDNRRDQDSG